MKIHFFISVILIILIANSCNGDEQCRKNKVVQLNMNLYQVTKSITGDTIIKNPYSIDSLTVKGLRYDSLTAGYILKDSILYNNSKSVSSINLPLQKFKTQTKFEITFNNLKDTITVSHNNSDQYLSLECGCVKVFKIDSIKTTHHFVDSAHITNPIVDTSNAQNIIIYK